MINIEKLGKGAVRTSKEILATQYRLAATPPLIDWSQAYKVPTSVPVLFQNGSSACTAFATTNYCMALEEIENNRIERYSRRYVYSQTSLGYGQGTYIWKAMAVPLVGLASEQSVPDGLTSELEMLDKSLNINAKIEARADKYAVIPRSDIDKLAQVIKDYHGFVTGFNGWDGMFASNGTIIDWSRSDWGHAIYVYGYELINGKKYLRFRNSWSSSWGSGGDGFIPEGLVNSGMMFDLYTYADISDLDPTTMNNRYVKVGELGKDVWLIRDGKRSLVYNALAFSLISGEWDKIEIITQAQFDAIPDTGSVLAGLSQE